MQKFVNDFLPRVKRNFYCEIQVIEIPLIVLWNLKEMFIFAVTRENVLHS